MRHIRQINPSTVAIESLEGRVFLSGDAAFTHQLRGRHDAGEKSNVAPALLALASEAGVATPRLMANGGGDGLVVGNGQAAIKVLAAPQANMDQLSAQLALAGFNLALRSDDVLIGSAPIALLESLGNIAGVMSIRPAYAARPMTGAVDTQGNAALRADIARQQFSVDGTGVTVGVISDSFDQAPSSDAADDIASGDLPDFDQLNILADTAPGTDEGRAMMQLIHDIAPGAALAFHSAGVATGAGVAVTDESIAAAIRALAAAGCNVIVDDIGSADEPMYISGKAAQAVDEVSAAGVVYLSAAANGGRTAYESAFEDSGVEYFVDDASVGIAHDFDPGPEVDTRQSITVAPGTFIFLEFQWDEPFFSVTGVSSQSDLDIYLVDPATDTVLADGTSNNLDEGTGDAVEALPFFNFTDSSQFEIVIVNFDGPNPGRMKYAERHSGFSIDEYDTNSSTLYGHANTSSGIAVAAAPWFGTPAFDVDPPELEPYSSMGGTPLLFDVSGNRLEEPLSFNQPRFTATDGGNTTFFGQDSGQDADDNPNFFGTSAAAPEAAAVAALMRQYNPDATPSTILTALQSTAVDMDDPGIDGFQTGFDLATGFGLIRADAALAAIGPAVDPLKIQSVYVRSAAWTPAFRQVLQTQGIAATADGIEINAATPQRDLPWTNLNLFDVTFTGPASAENIRISDSAGHALAFTAAPGDSPNELVLTTASPLPAVTVLIEFRANPANDFVPLYNFRNFPGDANGDVRVNAGDLVSVRNRVGRTASQPGAGTTAYDAYFDVNGDAAINASDLVQVRNRIGTSILVPVVQALPPQRSRDDVADLLA